MKFLVLAAMLASQVSFGAITAAQKYLLNNKFSVGVPNKVQLGTLIDNLEVTSTAGLDRGDLQIATVTVSSAEILALNTTPKTLVAAPGSGYALIPVAIYATMDYAAATYACNAAGLILKYTDGSGTAPGAVLTQGFCQSAADAAQVVNVSTTAYTPTTNAALVLHAGAANPTTGDSAIKVRVFYRRVPYLLP